MLTQKSITQLNFADAALSRQFADVAAAVNPVLQTPVVDGLLVQNLVIPANGVLLVPHGFGRPALGYLVCAASAPMSVPYAVASEQYSPNNLLVLHFSSGAGATVSLWVF